MKVCFHFENFDADVSSGTMHSMQQWYELLLAFNVTDAAIINMTDFNIPYISTDINTEVYPNLDAFLASNPNDKMTYVNKGGADYKDYDFSDTDWLLFGNSGAANIGDVEINTGLHSLYPREAAAIILAKATWQ